MDEDRPRIKVGYTGPMTPEVQAYLDQVERIMNERIDVPKLAAAADNAALAASVFGSADMHPEDFIRSEPDAPAGSTG